MERTSPKDPAADVPTASPFATLLRELRLAAGLTQEELAERSGVSIRAISDLERGTRTRPQRATLQLLADGLGLSDTARAALEPAARSRGQRSNHVVQMLDLPVGGFLGAVPEGPLVARASEIERIRGVVTTVTAGAGRLLLLAGEPGVGKTRLAQETTLICRASGMYLAAGRCDEPRKTEPFYPFLDVVSRLVAAARARLRIEPLRRWPRLSSFLPEAFPAGQASASLPGSPMIDEDDEQRLFWSMAELLEALAGAMPVVIALDDLQWADASSLDLLRYLVRRLRRAPILLLGIYRDEEVGRRHPLRPLLRDLHREHLAEEIVIRNLNQDGTAALMAATLEDHAVSPEFAELVHRHTEGNAFFVQEVARALVERGDAFRQDAVWECRTINQIAIPITVHEAISERVSRLADRTQAILHEASVLGETFAFVDLLAMGDRSEAETDDALDEAERASVVRVGEHDRYTFNHVLTRQVLYSELAPRRRKRLHLAAGDAIEQQPSPLRDRRAVELAWHFLQGGDVDRALRYTTLVGDQAEERFAHREAEQQYRVALGLARRQGETAIEALLLEKLGKALGAMDRYDEAVQVFDQSAALYRGEHDVDAEIRIAALAGRVHADRGTADEGIASARRMLDALEGREPSPGMAALYASLAYLFFVSGQYPAQLATAEQASALARRFGNDAILATAEVRRGTALSLMGRSEQALAVLLEAIPLADRAGNLVSLHRALAAVSEMYRLAGQFDQSRHYREQSRDVAERLGSPATIAFALATLGRVHAFQGTWYTAEVLLERALSIAASMTSWFTAYPALHLGELRLAQGAWDESSDLLEMAVTIACQSRDLQALRFAHQALAKLDLLHGRPESARERLEPLLDRPGLAEPHVTGLLAMLARTHLALGNVERAERIVTEALHRSQAQNTTLAALDALRNRGIVRSSQRRWDAAEQDFEQAAAMSRTMPYPYAEGRILYRRGLMERERGAPQQAREYLSRALVIFQRLGSRAYEDQTKQVLATLGDA